MKWWPRSLPGRLAMAMLAAIAGIMLLSATVALIEARREERGRPATRPQASAPPRGLGFLLAPVHGTVLLARRSEAFAPGTAPVVQVLADGRVALRRPAPRAERPDEVSSPDTDAGILLPARSLQGLDPGARAALLDLIAQLVEGRPVPPGRVRPVDFDAQPGELAVLLGWVR